MADSSNFPVRALARLVRAVAREESDASRALFICASNGRKTFSYPEWLAILADLDACPLTVAEWLDSREDWI